MSQRLENEAAEGISTRAGRAGAAERASYEPAYLQIANTLAEQIGAGVYRPGDQLPTEPQLRARFGVSPVTIRRAVNLLLDRGLVSTTQGKGTFVRSLDIADKAGISRGNIVLDPGIGFGKTPAQNLAVLRELFAP